MEMWQLTQRQEEQNPTCPLCRQLVPWILEDVEDTNIEHAGDPMALMDHAEIHAELNNAHVLLATLNVDAMLNDISRFLA